MDRWTVVSADGHFGCAAEGYRPYIEAEYRDRVDDLADEERISAGGFGAFRANHVQPGVYEIGQEAVELGDNVARRLEVLDEEGIAAEILNVGSDHAPPFFHVFNRPYSADVRAAGVRGYHRWVADVISEANGRLLPVAYAGEISEMDDALAELRWVKDHGFVSVFAPGYVADPNRPPLFDRSYDPLWAACTDLDLVLNLHAGAGITQGDVFQVFSMMVDGFKVDTDGFDLKSMDAGMKKDAPAKDTSAMDANTKGSPFALDMGPRQTLWRLMLGGVFDRFPSLRFVLTEVRADWIPATLAYLDERFAKEAPHLKLKPSEYFARNCAVTPSTPHRTEVEMRDEIGIDQFMFGADIPHVEGTWPHTHQFLRDAFVGVPEADARKILGENAIRFFNLDRSHLDDIASRIGPTADEVIGGGEVDERVVASLNARAGYLKPVEQIDITPIDERLESDFASVGAGG